MSRKRKRRNIPRHMLPENRRGWKEFNLQTDDEDEQGATIDWREIGATHSQRRNGRPLRYYMEERDDEEEQ
jgi:hypothetical protein